MCALAVGVLPGTASATVTMPGTSLGDTANLLGSVTGQPYAMGLTKTPSAEPSAAAMARVTASAQTLPASVDLTPDAMPVGDQGQVGSCAAWSTDYGALGYWENEQGIAGGGLEPMYTYSQVDCGVDEGSSIEGNLDIDKQQGIDTQSDYWQGNFDYSDQPTAAEKLNAVNWKLTNYNDLTLNDSTTGDTNQVSIETALAAGNPVVIGIPVYWSFEEITSADNGFYAGVQANDTFMGNHAIVALGYDSTGLRIENSWGTYWGANGYATLSWSFINQYVFDAVSVGPLVSGQPVTSAAPVLTGNAAQGQVLTVSKGTWSPAATASAYLWERAATGSSDWTTITGATGSTYTLGSSDVGDNVRAVLTASNGTGSGSAPSASVGPIANGAPVNSAAPSLTGTLRVGQTLTAAPGTWSPAGSYSYQWQRSSNSGGTWTAISNATSSTYVEQTADANDTLRVAVKATDNVGSATAYSPASGTVSGAPYNTVAPGITGTLRAGSTLTATAGAWSPAATSYSYQWQRSTDGGNTWASISGMTGTTYVLESSDVAAKVRIQVSATNANGQAYAWTVAGPIAAGTPVDTVSPTVSGTPRQGIKLTASTGTWNPAGTAYSYIWERSSGTGSGLTWTPIAGATSSGYTTAAADVGVSLRVVVTATNNFGSSTANSSATGTIASGAPLDTVAPKVSGTDRQGMTLSGSVGSWSPAGTTYAYQWERSSGTGASTSWTPVSSTPTYVLSSSDVGKSVKLVITATNAYGSVSAISTAVGPITSAVPANTVAPVISGTLRQGQTLKATAGTWSPAATSYSSAWERASGTGYSITWTPIAGATSATYTVQSADAQKQLRVVVLAVNTYGQTAANSGQTATIPSTAKASSVKFTTHKLNVTVSPR